MYKQIKELRKLHKLNNKIFDKEKVLDTNTYSHISKGEVEDKIKVLTQKVIKEINLFGWLIMFVFFIPLALMQLGIKNFTDAGMISVFGGVIFWFIISKILGYSSFFDEF